jgi:hypothetical protein
MSKEAKERETIARANVGNAIDALVTAVKGTRYPGAIGLISDALSFARQAHAMLEDCEERN